MSHQATVYTSNKGFDERIRSFPKAHLHLHFPRTMRPGTLAQLATREGFSLERFYEFTDLAYVPRQVDRRSHKQSR